MRRWIGITTCWIEWCVFWNCRNYLAFFLLFLCSALVIRCYWFRGMIWIHQEGSFRALWTNLKWYVDFLIIYGFWRSVCSQFSFPFPFVVFCFRSLLFGRKKRGRVHIHVCFNGLGLILQVFETKSNQRMFTLVASFVVLFLIIYYLTR